MPDTLPAPWDVCQEDAFLGTMEHRNAPVAAQSCQQSVGDIALRSRHRHSPVMQDDTTISDLARLAAHWSANLAVSCTRDRFSVRVLTSTGRRQLAAGEGPTMRIAAVHALDALRMLDAQERGAA